MIPRSARLGPLEPIFRPDMSFGSIAVGGTPPTVADSLVPLLMWDSRDWDGVATPYGFPDPGSIPEAVGNAPGDWTAYVVGDVYRFDVGGTEPTWGPSVSWGDIGADPAEHPSFTAVFAYQGDPPDGGYISNIMLTTGGDISGEETTTRIRFQMQFSPTFGLVTFVNCLAYMDTGSPLFDVIFDYHVEAEWRQAVHPAAGIVFVTLDVQAEVASATVNGAPITVYTTPTFDTGFADGFETAANTEPLDGNQVHLMSGTSTEGYAPGDPFRFTGMALCRGVPNEASLAAWASTFGITLP